MVGTIVNMVAIIIGGSLGVLLKKGIKKRYSETIIYGMALSVIVMGMMSAIKAKSMLVVIISIVLGSIIGEFLNIEQKLDNLGKTLESKFKSDKGNFSKGFVTASLIYCVGAMGIMGALEDGLTGNHQILFTKAILDGISSIIFASTLGIGVAFSAVPVLIYQGSISLVASFLKPYLTDVLITDMSAVGGILIIAIGINVLEIKRIRIGNMLPAIVLPVLYYIFLG
ncbi:DUF554 domain-containing protein [Clostridiaceae bacterium M8S5]|nr:DUF554 domain-containing protein [Clostridiaceae bacterium M8S5]